METQGELFSRRSVLERQDPAALLALKRGLQDKIDSILQDMILIDDVIDGYGYTRYDPGAAYDADDGTIGSTEREDTKWLGGLVSER